MDMRMKCEDPGDVVYTITVTAKASEWERFRDALDEVAHKSLLPLDEVHRFRGQIDSLLAQARKIYWPHSLPENTGKPVGSATSESVR